MPAPSIYAATLALMPFILAEAKAVGIDPLKLAAVVHTESRGQAGVIRRETNGSCSVGLGGVNVPDCDQVAVDHLLQAQANLRAAAVILKRGEEWCHARPTWAVCRRGGPIAMYNPGDRAYPARVRATMKAIGRVLKATKKARAS